MNKISRFAAVLAVLALVAVPAATAQNASVDARMNILAADAGNFFNWTLGSQKVADKFDAASGASIAGSTAGFDKVRYDDAATKKAAIPVGLRGLLLFPVYDFAGFTHDDLKVTENGKALTVRYVHRGTAYELTTDAKGRFNLLTGAKFAKGLADNVGGEFVLKPEFVKEGGDAKNMSDLDWSKIALVADAKDPAASRWYEGDLAFAYKNGVLTIKGKLTEKK